MRPLRRELVLSCAVIAACTGTAGAGVPFPSVMERVVGVMPDALPGGGGADARVRLETGDLELFGIAGLRLTGVRSAFRFGAFPVRVDVAQIGSPVGSHARIAADVAYAGQPGWRVGVRAGVERVAIAASPAQRGVIAGVVSSIAVGSVVTRADVESLQDASGRRVAMVLSVSARVRPAFVVVATARADTPGRMAIGLAALAPVHAGLSLLAGYDDGSETVRAGVEFRARRWEFSVAVFQHAVLGLSQGVSLAWSR